MHYYPHPGTFLRRGADLINNSICHQFANTNCLPALTHPLTDVVLSRAIFTQPLTTSSCQRPAMSSFFSRHTVPRLRVRNNANHCCTNLFAKYYASSAKLRLCDERTDGRVLVPGDGLDGWLVDDKKQQLPQHHIIILLRKQNPVCYTLHLQEPETNLGPRSRGVDANRLDFSCYNVYFEKKRNSN